MTRGIAGRTCSSLHIGSLEAFSAASPEEFILSSAFALGAGSAVFAGELFGRTDPQNVMSRNKDLRRNAR